ncbi:hypothetical protein CEXT_148761 [Caerostris extrusa]|uniref:Uncharacterized protein n=1 Tax=Caerostris extrusa TaxID=172846 RepID=A0AAV4R4J7_CAEEX|nr:hypothetical protein CEXT_148761 [Caerostris extrusa]
MISASLEKLFPKLSSNSTDERTREINLHPSLSLTVLQKIEKKKKKNLFQNFSEGEGDYFNSNKAHSRVNDSLLKEGRTPKNEKTCSTLVSRTKSQDAEIKKRRT